MEACGLIVEYNPFHNGHLYHLQEAKKLSKADCIVAVMSGSFLQRGEPAIIDKFHRTKACLLSGVDIVLELPYPYAVQSSPLFAKGAVRSLHEIGVKSICFGSESGNIDNFINSYTHRIENEAAYDTIVKEQLALGYAYPVANKYASEKLGFAADGLDLAQPNNILGYHYVKEILDHKLNMEPLTIKRTANNYHDVDITSSIASATSIRAKLLAHSGLTEEINQTMPLATIDQIQAYTAIATQHEWEQYFPLLHYRVLTMHASELEIIHGVDEGLEHRIIKTARVARSMNEWISLIKTKRYTWARLARMFVHILTNTKKTDILHVKTAPSVPYVRILGLSDTGRTYIRENKKAMTVPLINKLKSNTYPVLTLEEKATRAYYSMLPIELSQKLYKQEQSGPIILDNTKNH